MNLFDRRRWSHGMLLAGLALALGLARRNYAAEPLFTAAPAKLTRQSAVARDEVRHGFLRQRKVQLNAPMLAPSSPLRRQSVSVAGDAPKVLLNLFDDRQENVVITKTKSSGTGRFVAYGKIEGSPDSMVLLAVNNGVMAGTISAPGQPMTTISYAGDGYHILGELDPQSIPPCGAGAPILPLPAGEIPPAAGDVLTRVDVMVVYTAAARSGAGGTSAIEASIDLAVAEANETYVNSGINVELNLVYRGEVTYTETGVASTDLSRLQTQGDGQLDVVHTLRSQYGADVVVLLTESMATYAGLAYVMAPPSTAFSAYAFGVVKREYATGSYVFPHEVGHIFGCQHDHANASSGGAYAYSYGHRFNGTDSNEYRTVMAYAPGTRIPYFSNPTVNYQGTATGVSGTGATAADNTTSINNTSATVAGFAGQATFVNFEITATNVTETNVTLTFNVVRTGDTNQTSTVKYTTTGVSATAGSDYTAATGGLSFAPGETNQTIDLAILNDSVVESSEVVRLTLSSPTNAVVGVNSTLNVTIDDDDIGITFAAATASVSEDGTNAVVTVKRTGDTAPTVTVDYATSDLSATAGSDYTSTNGSLSFGAGVTNLTITVPITSDSTVETNETFKITLSNASGGTLVAPTSMTVTILEDDSTIAFTTNAVSVSELSTNIALTLRRTGGTNSTATIDYFTADDTATAGSDYTATNGTVTFAPGVATATINIPLQNDSSIEGPESFGVLLTNVVGATLGSVTNATVTIDDNDSSFDFSESATAVKENAKTVTLTVLRTGGSSGAASVKYSTVDGSATDGSDYTAKTGTLTFSSGQTNKTFTISLKADTTYETNETFSVRLSEPLGEATLGTVTNIDVTIQDHISYIAFETNSVTVAEDAGTATVNVLRTGQLAFTNTVPFTFTAGTAGKTDYLATNGTLTFGPNATNATITVGIIDDSLVENTESFTVKLGTPSNSGVISGTNTATINITENDIGLAFNATSYSVSESGTNVILTVLQTGNTNAAATVDYATSDLLATAGSDYTATNGTLYFNTNTNSLTITVPITSDTTVESNETFRVVLSNPSGGSLLSPSNVVVTILEDESVLELSTNAVSVLENAASATLTVLRTGGTNLSVTVDYFTASATATNGTDYTATNGTLTFGPGVKSQTITVPLLNDSDVDGDKTFTLTLTNAVGADLGTVTNATVTTLDNDSVFEFTTNAVLAAESAKSVTVSVARTGGLVGPATVRYATADDSAIAGSDYTAKSGVLTFKAGQTNQNIVITLKEDATYETNETFNVALSSPTGEASLGTNDTVVVTVTDNDSSLAFETNSVTVAENAGTATLNVLRTGTLTGTNTVKFAFKAGTAGTSDFKGTNGILTFLPNETNATITVAITDDSLIENDETFSVQLSAPTGGAVISGTNTAYVTIVENDVGLAFAAKSYSVDESGTNVTLVVLQTGNTNAAVTVDYLTRDLTATAGSDYTSTNGTLYFNTSTNSLTIVVPITSDTTLESNETFMVSLTNASGAILQAFSNSVVTILEDDVSLELATNALTIAENAGNATLKVIRTGGTNSTVTVDYFTTEGTATNSLDFVSTNGTLTIAPGLASATITVPLVNNSTVDGDRTFTLTLTNAVGTDLGTATNATVTIMDNDSTFDFSTNAMTVSEKAGTAVVTVRRAGGLIGPATVRYTSTSGSATAGIDFTAKSGLISFKAGETNKTISVPIKNDTAYETNRTFDIALSAPTGEGAVGTNGTVTVTLTDNDSMLAFETNAVSVAESAGTVTLNILRTGTLTETNTVKYTFKAGTAGTTDFKGTNGVLTFLPNETNATITVAITDDTLVEADEVFSVTLSTPTGGAVISGTNTAYVTIVENDVGLAFAASSYSVSENGTNITLTVLQTGNTNTAVTVDYATSDLLATAGSDYTATNGTLYFNTNTNSLTITIPITSDTTLESNETFRVSLSNPSGALLLAPSNSVVTILEDDVLLELSTNAVTVAESAGTVSLTVLRTGGTNSTVTVDYLTTEGTATNSLDFVSTNGTLTIAPGLKSGTITVPLVNNSTVDGDRTFTLTLTNASGTDLGSTTNATVTIQDNDSVFQFSTDALTVAESSGSATVTVVRSGGLIGTATVQYATQDDSATAPADYTAKSGVLSFKAGETNKTITVSLKNDLTYETNEAFNVVLSSPTGEGTLGTTNTVAVTITDNDSFLSFETNAVTIAENAGTVSLNVLRTGTLTGTNTLKYTFKAGTAGSSDFKGTNGILTFLPNETNATITAQITDDSLVEGTEMFSVQISSPTGGAIISGTNTAYVTITENDVGLAFSAASYNVAENGTNVTLTVLQTGNTNASVTVDYATADLGATDGSDYTATNGTLSFGAGTNSLTITVPILDDATLETNETFRVSLSNPTSGAILLANSNAVVRILEDDSEITFTTNAVSVLENVTKLIVTVARNGGTNFDASVDFLTVDGTATAGADYTATNMTLNFVPGLGKTNVTVVLLNDSAIEGNEDFALSLTNAVGTGLGTYTNLTVTVVDNDSIVSMATNAVSVSEAAGTTTFTVYRTGGVAAAATVRYTTADGTATAGSDYKTKAGVLKFAAGQTNQTISVSIINDAIVDADETFTIALSSPTGEATVGTNDTTTVTIIDNDFNLGGAVVEAPNQNIVISAFEWNPGSSPVIEVEGPLGAFVHVQASADLVNWEEVAEGSISGAPFRCLDAAAAENPIRFYRVIQFEPLDSQP